MRREPYQTLALLAGAFFLATPSLLGKGSPDPCAAAKPVAVFARKGEPGEPLRVTGRVFAPDGVTPAAGVILYAYQTDATGHYNRWPRSAPRLHGWMRTGPDGSYEFSTIRPAPYPNRRTPAHIHFHLWGEGVAPQWNRDFLFEDDPLVSTREREDSRGLGRFAFVHTLRRESGEWRGTHDIRLKPAGDSFEGNIRHGLKPCGVKP